MRKLSELLFQKKTPQQGLDNQTLEDYHAHGYLGNMYLSLGDLAQAELEFSRAYALFPSVEVQSQLATVRRRRAKQNVSARQPISTTRAA
jgi:tetratricopeptide (TPR) repeat protein